MYFKLRLLFLFIILCLISSLLLGQTSASSTLGFTAFPSSVASLGMGNNSVALKNSEDALTFNPANITYAKGITLSYFHNPFYFGQGKVPFTNLNLSFTIPSIGSFAFEYRNRSFGKISITTVENPDGTGLSFEPYSRSYSLGYARTFFDQFSLGASVRYGGEYFYKNELTGFLISIGVNYHPKYLEDRLAIGLSLMNLGNSIQLKSTSFEGVSPDDVIGQRLYFYEDSFPPPSFINLGTNFEFAKNKFYTSFIQIAFSKPIVEGDLNSENMSPYNGSQSFKSSFSALFSDWDDFPRDVNIHTGLAFEWEPIDLGSDLSYFQEMYLGNNSFGIANSEFNVFTHGVNIGIAYKDVQAKVGYTATWHFGHISLYDVPMFFMYPRESWQFSVKWSTPKFLGYSKSSKKHNKMKNIYLLAGAGFGLKLGKYSTPLAYIENKNSVKYSLEAGFYFNYATALISEITYSEYDHKYEFSEWQFDKKNIDLSISSSFRYHPFDQFKPLYAQSGFGVIRRNPVEFALPKYSYKSFFTNRVGAIFAFSNNLLIQPEINWQLILDRDYGTKPFLSGYNQIDFTIKFGYKF